jgi:hypothetical protein
MTSQVLATIHHTSLMKTSLLFLLLFGIFALIYCDQATKSEKPVYRIPDAARDSEVVFVETFGPGWKDRWVISNEEKYKGKNLVETFFRLSLIYLSNYTPFVR